MAHLPGRRIGLGIAMLSLLGATSAYAIAHTGPSTPTIPATQFAAASSVHGAARPADLNAPPPPPPKSSPPPAGPACTFNGAPIACQTAQGWWDGVDNCYWLAMPPPLPPAGAPQWMGNTNTPGTLYHVSCPANASIGLGFTHVGLAVDSNPPPGYNGVAGAVGQLEALQAILATNLLGPIVGSAPQAVTAATPNSVGLVGEPVWLWQEPTILTWGPLKAGLMNIGAGNLLGVAFGGVGVGLNALGARIDYYMGDGPNGGTVITCYGLGTPFPPLATTLPPGTDPLNTLLGTLLGLLNPLFPQPAPQAAPAGATVQPGCSNGPPGGGPPPPQNFRYSKPGTYTVTAAATWTVNWAVGLAHGSISVVRYTTFQLKIDELEVVVK
jgi:hypothetical protein